MNFGRVWTGQAPRSFDTSREARNNTPEFLGGMSVNSSKGGKYLQPDVDEKDVGGIW